MHKKYAKDGLAVVSVNVDEFNPMDEADTKTRDQVVGFLKDQKASFTNLVLDVKVRQEKLTGPLGVDAYPTTFVYDRTGKLDKKFEGPAHKEVEKLVVELLTK